MTSRKHPSNDNIIIFAQLFFQAVLIVFYALFFSRFFPNANQAIGHDYAYFFPHLLDGYFWFLENGLFNIPWFSPAFCGGIPAWANPQNIFYSLPQLLTFAFGPFLGVFVTVLFFVWLGYIGMYLLTRRIFNLSRPAASLAATLFFLNGFFFSRMAVGHLAFHAFMLTPLLCYFLFKPDSHKIRLPKVLSLFFYSVVAGLIWAYMFYGGMLVLLVQVIFCVIAVGCIYGLLSNNLKSFAGRFVLSGVIGLCIASSRLVAVSSLISNFPRNYYEIPGSTFWEGIELFFRSLFLPASISFSADIISHFQWNPQLHEYDFNISPVPVLILLFGALGLIFRKKQGLLRRLTPVNWFCGVLLPAILIIPFALNIYSPAWHEFLKSVPLIKAASTMMRWYVVYMVILIVASALVLEHGGLWQKYKTLTALTGIILAIVLFLFQPAEYYTSQYYSPANIEKAYHDHQTQGLHPQVSDVVMLTDDAGNHVVTDYDNDIIAIGGTQLFCDEPIFGYRLEHFPRMTLQPGPVSTESKHLLNLKNPACYIYPEENNCRPGDHFTIGQKDNMTNFAAYRSYPFQIPLKQTLANWISLFTFIGCLIYLLFYGGTRIARKFLK